MTSKPQRNHLGSSTSWPSSRQRWEAALEAVCLRCDPLFRILNLLRFEFGLDVLLNFEHLLPETAALAVVFDLAVVRSDLLPALDLAENDVVLGCLGQTCGDGYVSLLPLLFLNVVRTCIELKQLQDHGELVEAERRGVDILVDCVADIVFAVLALERERLAGPVEMHTLIEGVDAEISDHQRLWLCGVVVGDPVADLDGGVDSAHVAWECDCRFRQMGKALVVWPSLGELSGTADGKKGEFFFRQVGWRHLREAIAICELLELSEQSLQKRVLSVCGLTNTTAVSSSILILSLLQIRSREERGCGCKS